MQHSRMLWTLVTALLAIGYPSANCEVVSPLAAPVAADVVPPTSDVATPPVTTEAAPDTIATEPAATTTATAPATTTTAAAPAATSTVPAAPAAATTPPAGVGVTPPAGTGFPPPVGTVAPPAGGVVGTPGVGGPATNCTNVPAPVPPTAPDGYQITSVPGGSSAFITYPGFDYPPSAGATLPVTETGKGAALSPIQCWSFCFALKANGTACNAASYYGLLSDWDSEHNCYLKFIPTASLPIDAEATQDGTQFLIEYPITTTQVCTAIVPEPAPPPEPEPVPPGTPVFVPPGDTGLDASGSVDDHFTPETGMRPEAAAPAVAVGITSTLVLILCSLLM